MAIASDIAKRHNLTYPRLLQIFLSPLAQWSLGVFCRCIYQDRAPQPCIFKRMTSIENQSSVEGTQVAVFIYETLQPSLTLGLSVPYPSFVLLPVLSTSWLVLSHLTFPW